MIGLKTEIYNRELRWTELLSSSMHIFAAIFGSFLKVLLFIFLPISLLEGVILGRMTATSAAIGAIGQVASPSAVNIQEMTGLFMQMMTQEFLLYAVAMFLQPVGTIAIARMVKQFIDGEKIEAGEAISEALSHMPAILITGFLFGVLVLLGSFVIVPGIYFGIAWGLYAYCIVFENKKGWDALRASKVLVQGRWLRTAGYLFLLSTAAMLWNSVFQLIASFLGESAAADVLYQFLCYISVGFVAVGECLLYLNRKAVAEGACVFGTTFVDAPEDDMPAEPVEGTVDGVEEELSLLEEKKDENENK
ncbi:MAG: hypothetical protein IKI92_05400 [Anaerotignum sp.]|nr:hypothetical protein [Anaerotignum sp.]